MRSVTLGGDAMNDFPRAQDGGYVKLMLPPTSILSRPVMRTYTIRRQLEDGLEIEFALHGEGGEGGPAVEWAVNAKRGDEILIGGPGPAKPLILGADWYLVVGDMTALPAIAVNLAQLPGDAVGDVVIEVQSIADQQDLVHPPGINVHWIVNEMPGANPDLIETKVRSIAWRPGKVYAWSATEFDTMRRVRTYLRNERGLTKDELYISSYWKQGANEDLHKKLKSADANKSV